MLGRQQPTGAPATGLALGMFYMVLSSLQMYEIYIWQLLSVCMKFHLQQFHVCLKLLVTMSPTIRTICVRKGIV